MMATVQVTEKTFETTVQKGIVLLAAQPGAIPARALDDLVEQARALDMNEVRRSLEEQQRQGAAPGAAKAGAV
jgi:hypothetical protein